MDRPLVEDLRYYNVNFPQDTTFSAYARLLQSKWRFRKGYPFGKLGNYIENEYAKREKVNYLTNNIKNCVDESIIQARINGGMIAEPRIWNNLLSSQPLCFNMFGEMHYDLEFATEFFQTLFSTKVKRVTSVKFEFSPSRGNKEYTGDHSAFDVFIEYFNHQDEECFIGIEVKYAETLKEESKKKAFENFKNHKQEYERLTLDSSVFKVGAIEHLKQVPIAQIWRDHLLSIASKKDFKGGFFVFLFPSLNEACRKGVDLYRSHLISPDEEETGFYPRYLETFIETLNQICDSSWAKELKERYLGV